mmetsp:Transcript_103824/g.268761  ORF Transcript_103824/g.268761 Transcript_103824/m.268761 type:complete len:258 (-) Transcript_103824:606-1379(-)
MCCSVRMLCSLSANLITSTRTSFAARSSTFRRSCTDRLALERRPEDALVTPSTSEATEGPKRLWICATVIEVSSTVSWSRAAMYMSKPSSGPRAMRYQNARASSSSSSGGQPSAGGSRGPFGVGMSIVLARMSATAKGWVQYGSPDFRIWPLCAFLATMSACSSIATFWRAPTVLGSVPHAPAGEGAGAFSEACTPWTHQRFFLCSSARRKSSSLLDTSRCAWCTSARFKRPSLSRSLNAQSHWNSLSTMSGEKDLP